MDFGAVSRRAAPFFKDEVRRVARSSSARRDSVAPTFSGARPRGAASSDDPRPRARSRILQQADAVGWVRGDHSRRSSIARSGQSFRVWCPPVKDRSASGSTTLPNAFTRSWFCAPFHHPDDANAAAWAAYPVRRAGNALRVESSTNFFPGVTGVRGTTSTSKPPPPPGTIEWGSK